MRYLIVVSIFILSGCSIDRATDRNGHTPFAAVLANLSHYNGKDVKLITYASLEFEGQAAYLTEDDYENMIFINGLWLNLPSNIDESKLNKRGIYAISGTVNLDENGHFGMWIGAIDVKYIEEYLVLEETDSAEQGDSEGTP